MIPISTPTDALAGAVVSAVTTAAAATATAAITEGDSGGNGECSLLGSFALIVQAALGGLALLSLVYKRWRERPQRPVKIWFFDVSKQVFGSVLVHIANIFMSMLTSGRFSVTLEKAAASNVRSLISRGDDDYTPNPCSFYLLNLAIDTTIGIPILIVLLRVLTGLVSYTPLGKPEESIRSGNYGNPPNAWWWLKQSIIYFCGLFGMKFCVLVIFLLLPWISHVGDWALRWTEGNEQLQIFFVMMFFPLIMNALQYYIIDSFIKQPQHEHERLSDEEPDWDSRHAGVSPYDDADSDSGGDADSDDGASLKLKKASHADNAEYNPDVDGDAPTVVGSSSSRTNHQRSDISQELFPKE
ncbi:Vacuolar membrane protein [Colletotrichum chlorophyti]|uniref:Vacuolar membrane protein n=1 Tax=Colletotrichum chlorophyti TaxID=708187 RepID=A0A1Q8RW89_9PEZI|nr:Vacuolar membrane protein [Colletotrichum chlorophyti]